MHWYQISSHNKNLCFKLWEQNKNFSQYELSKAIFSIGIHLFNYNLFDTDGHLKNENDPFEQCNYFYKLIQESMNLPYYDKEVFMVTCEILLWASEYFGP